MSFELWTLRQCRVVEQVDGQLKNFPLSILRVKQTNKKAQSLSLETQLAFLRPAANLLRSKAAGLGVRVSESPICAKTCYRCRSTFEHDS